MFIHIYWLVGFASISTLVGYLMPNSVFTYIKLEISNELFVDNILIKPGLICLHTVIWFQVLLSNINNSV